MPTVKKVYDVPVAEAAEATHTNIETLRRWGRTGKVPAQKSWSGQWFFCRDDLPMIGARSGHVVVEVDD